MFHLVIQVPLDVALVSRETFEDTDSAQLYIDTHYTDFPAIEILSEEEVAKLTARVVRFPEKVTE